jgi:outer membrane receptor protein involved in Fe transport
MASPACIHARLAVSVSALALMLGATPVLAQSVEPQDDMGATAIEDVIVTAQKREQSIQDVPIAVTALSAEALESLRIDGGPELLRAIPNVTFSKSNFSMYNFAIRGVGTKAISASSDPAVAVSFNNAPLLRNRLFEQEYLDVRRVEVLRGPQGTLYGRNATAGVVNMIPNLPAADFDARFKAEVGNFNSLRGQAMLNIPLSDIFWVRAAGSFTQRDGFDHNTFTDEDVNGRNLWSTRLSASLVPNDRFRADLIWEHFEEDDDRSRTGKQLCTRDPGPSEIAGMPLTDVYAQGKLSQGCLPGSLYAAEAYGTPNGSGMGQFFPTSGISLGWGPGTPLPVPVYLTDYGVDPFAGVTQSTDMREIATAYDPQYRATNDVYQLTLRYDLTDNLALHYQATYAEDNFYSTQDYNRYVSNPIFNSSDGLLNLFGQPLPGSIASPGGVYTDPQLGPSDRMLSVDLSTSDNSQFYNEIRLESSGLDRFNFSIGAAYLDFQTEDNYYVFNNTFSAVAEYFYNGLQVNGVLTTNHCTDGSTGECVYVDYSPLSDLAGDGHNYFRSRNVVSTKSWAVFGEGYLDVTDTVRATLGLRYSDDKKTTTPYPSQLLLGYSDLFGGVNTGGSVVRGYPALPDIRQNWSATTGRFALDWRPTENVLLYASYARGYKGGGANPPRADLNPAVVQYQPLPETFEPEYVNAFEIGAKTDLLDGALRLNATAFYSDYTDYQVSQIVDRISLNENFDAETMGLELELIYQPVENFRIDANFGYLKTRIADGESSIDVMNRTQGNPDWMVVRPWVQVPSNCIAPRAYVEAVMSDPTGREYAAYALSALCGGAARVGSYDPNFDSLFPFWALFGFTYNPLVDAPNGGRGFAADLSGNELPNAPRFTANVGAQYTWNLGSWDVTLRGDYYRQSSSYFRVYNTEYDRIEAWDNVNLAISLEDPSRDLLIQAYVKNLFDGAPIVDAFTNSDDSMLTTNVFTLDPRIIGLSIAKRF